MSTKMSNDLILERSSTRLHAPPGGKSSMAGIFGGYEAPAPKADAKAATGACTQGIVSQQYMENIAPQRNGKATSLSGHAMQSGSSMKDLMGGDSVAAPARRRQAPGGNSTFTLG